MKKQIIGTAVISALLASTAVYAATSSSVVSAITAEEVEKAQMAWGNGIVKIGKAEDPREAAISHIDKFYAFGSSDVLFKPTLAAEDQFRGDEKEALSYFIGQDMEEDKGFALAPYTNVRWENEGIIVDGDSAMAMGNYFFTTTEGNEVKVEYTFGYMKDEDGNVKINLHHSSLPYSG